ncbi:hypothetical protein LCGC14_3058090, partial [marine sediment metagenome]
MHIFAMAGLALVLMGCGVAHQPTNDLPKSGGIHKTRSMKKILNIVALLLCVTLAVPAQAEHHQTSNVGTAASAHPEATKAGFEMRALSTLNAGQVIEYRNGSEWVRFQPMALQYSNDLDQIQPISMPASVAATVDDDTLTWMGGYGPGLDFSWQVQTARLMKLLTINAPTDLPAVDQFILDGGNPVLELNLIFAFSNGVTPYVNGQPWGKGQNAGDRDTQGLVEFRDGQGNILWWFNLPRSWDSEGNEQLGTFRFKKQGNSLFVTHRVPLSFVQNAVYPLMVDTTIDEQVGFGVDDAKEKALNLALNKISGEWDFPALKDLLEELDTGAFDMEIT